MTRFNYSCTKLDAASRVVNVNSVTTARYTTPSIHNTVFHNLFTYSVYRPGTRWLGTSCFDHQRPGGLATRRKLKLYSGSFFFTNFANISMQQKSTRNEITSIALRDARQIEQEGNVDEKSHLGKCSPLYSVLNRWELCPMCSWPLNFLSSYCVNPLTAKSVYTLQAIYTTTLTC